MKKLLAAALATLPALALAQGVAWVSSEKDAALTLLDLGKQEVVGTVATCKRPRHMMLSPDRKQLLVACSDSSQLDVIDVATKKSVRRIPFGEDPEVFDLSPDGKTAYVGLEDDGQLAIVDMATGKTQKTIEVGKEPEGVLTSKDGRIVWVTSEVANMVHAVDVATGKVTNIKVGKRPRRFALTPDGNQLWVTNELGASVSIIDPKTNQVTGTIEFQVPGARSTEITPVGRVRTSRRALERMEEYLEELQARGATDWIVQHAQSEDAAAHLVARGREILGKPPLFCTQVGPVLGAHLGKGMLVGGMRRSSP